MAYILSLAGTLWGVAAARLIGDPDLEGPPVNGADAYCGAETVHIKHASLKPGDPCPNCHKGTVYTTKPSRLVRIRGQAPLGAKVVELEKLRCGLCGAIFTAQTPPEVGTEKYDAEAAGMIALLKYGSGVPFNRPRQPGDSAAGGDPVGDHPGLCRYAGADF